MSAPATRADDPARDARLRRVVQVGYALQALSLLLALLGETLAFPAAFAVLPAIAVSLLHRSQGGALRASALAPHAIWQSRTLVVTLASVALAMLVLGPLLFVGLSWLAWAIALVGLWMAWRIGRGVVALLKDQPLPTRSGKDA